MEKEQTISKKDEKEKKEEIKEEKINDNDAENEAGKEDKGEMAGKEEKPKTFKAKKGKEEKKKTILDMIKFVVPGTSLRNSISNIVKGGHGALIVFGSPKMQELFEGGFRVNCKFTEQKLTELSKMDGATILSDDLKRILYANTLLVPGTETQTNETGTRHKAAERTAKQAETLVIAVSERRKQATLYYKDQKYVLKDSDEILRRATETLNILEKEKDVFDNLMNNFNILEITNLVYARDVCSLLQKIEIIVRMENIIKRYLLEMGNEGIIVKMRLKELIKNIEKDGKIILNDYAPLNQKRLSTILSHLNYEGLLDIETLSRLLFESHPDDAISPKGYRILSKTNLSKGEVKNVINYFGNLNLILNANLQQLKEILKNEKRAETLQKELSSVKEQLLMGRKI